MIPGIVYVNYYSRSYNLTECPISLSILRTHLKTDVNVISICREQGIEPAEDDLLR